MKWNRTRIPPKKLTIEERQKLLLELLRKEGWLDKLKEWPPKLALKFEWMLMEHHNIFSLEPNEIGCTDAAEHIIELLDKEPFKERFHCIAPPLVEEVQEHLQEMVDGGVICPATFQRLMQNCLRELNLTYALIYLDDMIVFSRTEEEHHCLRVVFDRFLEHRLKLKPSKCHFLQDEITFLGHEISADGMRPGTANLKAIAEMAPPKTYTEIWHFTGMTGFFWQFIKGYSKIAKPLNDLLEGEASKLKNEELELMPQALQAFKDLKKKCMTAPVLVFADFKKPFRLETDASGEGLGAVLLQESDDGQYHPVAFASRELKGGEPKYHSSKLEFLALKWAVMEQFRKYLQYQPFTVRTDNNPLTYILTTPNLDALGHRWVAALAGYNMKLEYLKGSDNKNADTLSRLPLEKLNEEAVAELLDYAHTSHKPRAETANINVIEESE